MKKELINQILNRVINPALRNDLSLLLKEDSLVVMAEGYGHCQKCCLFVLTVDDGYYSYKSDKDCNNDLTCILNLMGDRVIHPNPMTILRRETQIALN